MEKVWNMEWRISKGMEYGKFPFHSLACPGYSYSAFKKCSQGRRKRGACLLIFLKHGDTENTETQRILKDSTVF